MSCSDIFGQSVDVLGPTAKSIAGANEKVAERAMRFTTTPFDIDNI